MNMEGKTAKQKKNMRKKQQKKKKKEQHKLHGDESQSQIT
jgi:hypothetical protein